MCGHQHAEPLLFSPSVLGHPNFSILIVVYTDASVVGLGAVLVQKSGTVKEEVLAFASPSLNSAERNYSATEMECLIMAWALERWRHYLEGRIFSVLTDHAALLWVFKTTKPCIALSLSDGHSSFRNSLLQWNTGREVTTRY